MNELYVDSVRKQIRNRSIVNGVYLSCKPGEIIGLLGRNGAGKSTLLKIIFGSLDADNKFRLINKKRIASLRESSKLLKYLPQDNSLPNHIKIKNIIRCFCGREMASKVIHDGLVKPFLEKRAEELSLGERRIIEVILMVHSGAEYLLFDEPFSGISPLHIETIKNIIKKHSRNVGIVITDHNYRNVLDVASRVVLMNNGSLQVINEYKDLISFGYLPAASDV